MNEESIKIAFAKAKQDINSLENELFNLKSEIGQIKGMIRELLDQQNTQNLHKISSSWNPTIQQITPTDIGNPTDNPTVPQEIRGLKYPNLMSSIGNEGVPTDRQTNSQTGSLAPLSGIESNLQEATNLLDSLDRLRREIRLKFKRITPQEMAVFSSIYQLEEQIQDQVTYKEVALKLKLSESSIRDYVQRMISKGIPIKKQKINNKKITLSISKELKKIATLSAIIQLREL